MQCFLLVVVVMLVHLNHFDSSISPKRFTHSETISGVCISNVRHVATTQKGFFTFQCFILVAVRLNCRATLIEEK